MTRSRRLGPIGVRLALAFVAVALVAVAVLAALTVIGTRSQVDDLARSQRQEQAASAAAAAAQAYQTAGGWEAADLGTTSALAASGDASLEVRDRTGAVVAVSAAQRQMMSDLMARMHGEMTTPRAARGDR